MRKLYFPLLILFMLVSQQSIAQKKPLEVGIIGLTHTHVHWLLGRPDQGDIKIVGIVEKNKELARRYADQHGYSMDLVFDSMEEFVANITPDAVTAFGTIYDHLAVVEYFAPLGVHVMVEKPLSVNKAHAMKMKQLAEKHGIELLTNYETTWYPSNHKIYEMVHQENKLGEIRKVVIHDGHPGPKEIGVNKEFLEWLTDPVKNGGGALTDFGCYGINLATWLMKGEAPDYVFAVTQQMKPEAYPKVDDEATIVLTYPKTQVIVQASWNWPVSRKDMEVYGTKGQAFADNSNTLRYRLGDDAQEIMTTLKPRSNPMNDPFSYLAAVVNDEIQPQPADLSALENNVLVMRILEAAKKSAKTGRKVRLGNK